jgi:hypothetical protein
MSFRGSFGAGLLYSFFSVGADACGALAGNDGTMDDTKQKSKTDNANSETGNTTNDSALKRAGRRRATRKDGVQMLRKAADQRVGEKSEELADVVTGKALKGDLASVKVLVELADGKKPVPEPVKRRRGLTQAERWAMEPQWQDKPEKQGLGARD